MKKYLLLMSLFSLLMTTNLWAAGHEKKGKHFFSEVLELNEKKTQAIEKLIAEKKKETAKLHLEIEKKNIALKEEMIGDMNLQNIKSILEERSKINVQKQFLEFETDAKIRKKLTEKQWSKYIMHKKMKKNKMKNHGKHNKSDCSCHDREKSKAKK